jgi:hypothetical protein
MGPFRKTFSQVLHSVPLKNRLGGVMLVLVGLALPGGLLAQQFQALNNSLYFTRPYAAPDPLPQVLAISSTGNNFEFSVTPSTSNGGNWLSTSPTGASCCVTPRGVSVIVTTSPSMTAATYTGQVVFSAGGVTSVTVSVTLVIAAPGATFFDNTPGQISFSTTTGGQPPPQVLQIRNGGAGTLNWTLTATTFNAGSWLSVSQMSGTAPSTITVSILAQNLPGNGLSAGTYGGLLLFQSSDQTSTVTIPVAVTMAANAMSQVNALFFTKPYTGKDPLPQTVTIANAGAAFEFSISSSTATGSTGGTWLTVSQTGGGCCVTPDAITISPHPSITLAAGIYTGQVVADNGTQVMVIPVTLTISAPTADFFDNTAGQMSFYLQTMASNPPPNQLIQIRNAGAGTLNWTLIPTTFDSGSWLSVSATSGTAPSQISVGITVANLSSLGLTPGVFTANLLFQSDSSSITIPITVQVGGGFEPVNGLNFTMPQQGANPLPQNITIVSLGANVETTVSYFTATGGSWLTVTPSGGGCCVTPDTLQVGVSTAPTMAAGTYTAEIVVYSGKTSMTVPVTLTIVSSGNPYLDNLPGELTFSMQTSAPHGPPSQVFQIRNAGSGTLNWTLTPLTSDGGAWLTVSAANGAAPALITVGIVPGNLPGAGFSAGVFAGQLLLQTGGSTTTIPVLMDVGTNVFEQVNGINFTMVQHGANPLPQVLTITGTAAAFEFSVIPATATGGNWLTVSPTGSACCVSPDVITVSVNPSPTMAAGTYSGQVTFLNGTVSETVPITLTIAPAGTDFFDDVPGGLSYELATGAGNPASQNVQIRNYGTGTLSWTAQTATFDGGNWLTVSAPSGTAPSLLSIGIVTANLPSQGLVPGIFSGQVLFLSDNSSVTIPISVLVGGTGYVGYIQTNGISFTMPVAGANPLPQVLTAVSTGANFEFSSSVSTGNGGSWMTVSPVGSGCCVSPDVVTVTVTAPVGMTAGTYTGQVVLNRSTSATVIPVTLTVAPSTAPFFDNLQGQMSFFAAVGATPASQTMLIEGLGAFGLNWTLTPMTADNGNWLVPSVTTGTAPSSISVGINIQNLPSEGLVAGQFTGQLLFQSASSSVTVPVSVKLGPPGFTQLAGLNFSMPYSGSNPLSQPLSASSSGANFEFSISDSAGNGGSWLSTTPSGVSCCVTPRSVTFNVNGAPGGTNEPAGIHTGQAVFNQGNFAMTVPVILTVQGTPIWSIAKSHTGNFNAGQSGATYTVTVSNQSGPGVGTTSGTVTVTETVPTGMTLVSMAGTGWTCPSQQNTCTRSDGLISGQSYPAITVTVNVVTTTQTSLTNHVSVSGGGTALAASASDPTAIITRCDLNQSGAITVSDVQTMINEILGLAQAVNDLNSDGVVSVVDVQIMINAALGSGCFAM